MSKKNKNIKKRKNDDKLALIREEDEKSKCLSSAKGLEEELNSTLKALKTSENNRMTKDKIIHNSNIGKIVLLLNNIYGSNYFYDKKYFIFKLKIIFLFSCIKSILYNKIEDTNVLKYLRKINKNKKKPIYYKKIKNKGKQISNINIVDKINLNNIIKSENMARSHSFEYHQNFKDDMQF